MSNKKERTILMPVDDQDATDATVEIYLKEIHRPGDTVHVMTVVPLNPSELSTGMPLEAYPMTVEPNPDDAEQDAVRLFLKRRVLDKLEAAGVPYKVAIVHYLVNKSSIGEAICARADEIKASMVILQKHQRGKLASFFVGSVTDYCVKHCRRNLKLLHPGP